MLDLHGVLDREIKNLSGGELQRFIIGMICVQQADVYMFDEPSSYLDVKQRLKAARMIRSLLSPENYVLAVEHDLSILDYMSDFICCLYGVPGAYGVVTLPSGVREGINIFLAGFIPSENMRFRDEELTFKVSDNQDEKTHDPNKVMAFNYPPMVKTFGSQFKLSVERGSFNHSEIIVMLGQNGTGKTTFIQMLAGLLQPDGEVEMPKLNVSYKPQKIAPKFQGNVQQLLDAKLKESWLAPLF